MNDTEQTQDIHATYKYYRSLGFTKSKADASAKFQQKILESTRHFNRREDLINNNALLEINERNRYYGFVNERIGWVRELGGFLLQEPIRGVSTDLQIKINNSDYGEGKMLEHHESRVELYREFSQALRSCGYDNIEKFDVSKVELPTDCLNLLLSSLTTKNVTILSLKRTGIGWSSYEAFTAFMRMNTPLEDLRIIENKIGAGADVSVGVLFFNAVAAHTTVEKLLMEDCGIGDDDKLLSAAARTFKKLKCFDLRGNDIGTKGSKQICGALGENPTLKRLDLRDNPISDDDADLFARALSTNTNLDDIYLQGTDVTDKGIKKIIDCLFNTSSMKAVQNSNHTCQVHFGGDKMNDLECISWINRHDNLQLVKKEKEAVFREFRRNLPQHSQLQNPWDVQSFQTNKSDIRRERNAAFRKAGKIAMLYLARAQPNLKTTSSEDVRRRNIVSQLRNEGYDRKYCMLAICFDEHMNRLAHDLKNQITHQSKFITVSKGDKSMHVKLNINVLSNGHYQLLYHDQLLNCWRELSDQVDKRRSLLGNISLIEISNIQLTTGILKMLLPSLAHKVGRCPVSRLVLNDNSLGDDGISVLASFVREKIRLTSLEIRGTTFDTKSSKLLASAISQSTTIMSVRLEKCQLGESLYTLSSIVNPITNLTSVYLSSNHITSAGAILISDIIATNPPLEELYLNDNEFYDEDMVPIAKALIINSNLRKLFLRNNIFSHRAEQIVHKIALWRKRNILTIFNSNHTCQVFLNHRSSTTNTGTPKNNMYNKLYKIALTDDERDDHSFSIKLFRGVTISLMPTALSLAMKSIKIASGCQRKTNKKMTLNCLFKFLKSWTNPELLTYGSQPGAQRSLLAFGFTAVTKKNRGRGKKRKRGGEKVCTLS